MRPRAALVALLALVVCHAAGSPAARSPVVADLLDRYAAGYFDDVVAELSQLWQFDGVLRQLREHGPAWMDGGGPADRPRRELVAATFALEAARAGQWREWKLIQRQPLMVAGTGESYQPPSVLYWKAPPLIIEWACAMLRGREAPHPQERWWHLAALAVAQRSEDPQFLIGDTNLGAGLGTAEIGNTQDEIKHLDHAEPRLPGEPRFLLAQGIARERAWPEDAVMAYTVLERDQDAGGEAMMRLGALRMRQRNTDGALKLFARAEQLTRDPYVVFLARHFSGQIHEQQGRLDQAEAAYRGAAAAVPRAQSATVALAGVVFRQGRRAEGQRLVADMLAADPRPLDPWRAYVHADDRFWPELVGRLRAEILR